MRNQYTVDHTNKNMKEYVPWVIDNMKITSNLVMKAFNQRDYPLVKERLILMRQWWDVIRFEMRGHSGQPANIRVQTLDVLSLPNNFPQTFKIFLEKFYGYAYRTGFILSFEQVQDIDRLLWTPWFRWVNVLLKNLSMQQV